MKRIVLILILLISNSKTFSQTNAIEKKYTKEELNKDLDYLVNSIIETHPNPFSIISKKQFLEEVNKIKLNLNNGLDYREFYKLIAPLVASISDGHTSIKFPGRKILNDGSKLFPFSATCDFKKKSIIINEYIGENSPIPSNAELISINNISSEKIIQKIIENTSGESKEYRLKMGSNFYFFGMILKTYYDFDENFEIKYKANDKIENKIIEAVSFKDFMDYAKSKKNSKNQTTDDSADYILTVKPETKTAIIDFKYFNDEQKFDLFLKKSFDSINKIGVKNLIIDIRANGGGNSALGDQLFKYIAKKPFTQFGKLL